MECQRKLSIYLIYNNKDRCLSACICMWVTRFDRRVLLRLKLQLSKSILEFFDNMLYNICMLYSSCMWYYILLINMYNKNFNKHYKIADFHHDADCKGIIPSFAKWFSFYYFWKSQSPGTPWSYKKTKILSYLWHFSDFKSIFCRKY